MLLIALVIGFFWFLIDPPSFFVAVGIVGIALGMYLWSEYEVRKVEGKNQNKNQAEVYEVEPNWSVATSPPRWIRSDGSVSVAGRDIGGMVYVSSKVLDAASEQWLPLHACIVTSLRVANKGSDLAAEGMSYYPSYVDIRPVSRATYLDWLATGRSNREYNVGYVFLYFYGLEYRFFSKQANRAEREEIISEVQRLLDIYGGDRSVRNYMSSFLHVAPMFLSKPVEWTPVFDRVSSEIPVPVRVAIGVKLHAGEAVPAAWMLSWYMTHPETSLRQPAKRAFPEFRALFEIRFSEQYPTGLKISLPKRKLKFSYISASSDYSISLDDEVAGLPDISGLSKPVKIAAEVANGVMTELEKFSRYLGKNPEGRETIEAHALLPYPIRALFPCPELDSLRNWANEHMKTGGRVPVASLLQRLEGVVPTRISKRQLVSAGDALASLSIGMAPDPRFSFRRPKLDENVILFPLPSGTVTLEKVSDAYPLALLKVMLGMYIAHADGVVSEAEHKHLELIVAGMDGISEAELTRLRANIDWMTDVPPNLSAMCRRLRETSEDVRHEFGRLALAVAGADGRIEPGEVNAVRKLYRALDMDGESVYGDLHEFSMQVSGPVSVQHSEPRVEYSIPREKDLKEATLRKENVVLNPQKVSEKWADTNQVRNLLHEIFTDEQDAKEDADEMEVEMEDKALFPGLDPKHAILLQELICRPSWTSDEFGALSKKYGLPLADGAMETINEWAYEKFEEPLIDEDGMLQVNMSLINQPRGE